MTLPAASSSQAFHQQYTSGTVVIENPIQLGSAFICAFVVCALVEKLYATANEVNNNFFRVLFPAVSEEVLVLGTLSLLLTLGSSLIPGLSNEWAVMADWAQVQLLFMVIMFIVVVSAIAVVWNKTIGRFEKFETQRLGTRGMEVDEKEQLFTLAVNKFKLAMKAFGYPKPVFLSRYLRPIGEGNVVKVANLTWKVWLALSGMVVLNALRTKVVDALVGGDGILNVVTFIIVCGYGPLALYGWVHRRLMQRCEQFLQIGAAEAAAVAASMDPTHGALAAVGLTSHGREVNDAAAAVNLSRMDLEDPTAFLIWQSHATTITILQVSFFFLVWFSSVFFLSMMHQIFTFFNVGLSLFLFVLAVTPLTVYSLLCPWTFVIVAILSSLGTSLDETAIRRCQREREEEMAMFLHGEGATGGRDNSRNARDGSSNNRAASSPGGGGDAADDDGGGGRVSIVGGKRVQSVRKLKKRPVEFNDEEMSRLVLQAQADVMKRLQNNNASNLSKSRPAMSAEEMSLRSQPMPVNNRPPSAPVAPPSAAAASSQYYTPVNTARSLWGPEL